MAPRLGVSRGVAGFLLAVFVGSWAAWLLADAGAGFAHSHGAKVLRLAGYVVPAVAAVWCTWKEAGGPALREWIASGLSARRLTLRGWAVALLLMPGLLWAAAAIAARLDGSAWPRWEFSQVWQLGPVTALIAWIISPLCEELGWRGYAFRHLQTHLGPLRAALLAGALHAIWHLPLVLLPGGPLHGIAPWSAQLWLLMTGIVLFGVLAAALFNAQRYSVLAVTVLHGSMNAAGSLLAPGSDTALCRVLLLAAAVLALVAATRARLFATRQLDP